MIRRTLSGMQINLEKRWPLVRVLGNKLNLQYTSLYMKILTTYNTRTNICEDKLYFSLKYFLQLYIVVKLAGILAEFILWTMNAYLTTVWNFNYTRATKIVNVFSGLVEILPLTIQFLVDAFMVHYWVLFLSKIFYTVVSLS